jgi:peptidoglycan/xylan/chitin deacetylase (PgdA/CDA1 family)
MKKFILIISILGVGFLAMYFLQKTSLTLFSFQNDSEKPGHEEGSPEMLATIIKETKKAVEPTWKAPADIPQFVLLSFDGSKSITMLNKTRDFAKKMATENKPLHFTYFINAAYFLSKENADLYQPPLQPKGTSAIGFSTRAKDIPLRVQGFVDAVKEGHEIGSHTVGHWNGANWSYDDWKQEFTSFNTILSSINSFPAISNIVGFRAPELGVNDNLYKTLKDFHFTYDASGVGLSKSWPKKDAYGIWHIPLGVIHLGAKRLYSIPMDYNLWMLQSAGKEEAKKGTPLWNSYKKDVLDSYLEYFNSNYSSTRAPIVIGNHFSQWNDGVYFEAMKSFAEEVCGKPSVRCVTFKELVNYLNTSGVPAPEAPQVVTQ